MHEKIAAKTLSPATVKQRSNLIGRILPRLQDGHLASLEARHIKTLMKEFQKAPHQANNMLKTIRAMFRFAIDEDLMGSDPSIGVKSNSKVTDGFACWTRDDVRTFYQRHPFGTKANLALTLLIVTACRRSDLVLLGPRNIEDVDGQPYISFVQEKTGYLDRAPVQIPLMTPLANAISVTKTGEETFLITDYGKTFSKMVLEIGSRHGAEKRALETTWPHMVCASPWGSYWPRLGAANTKSCRSMAIGPCHQQNLHGHG